MIEISDELNSGFDSDQYSILGYEFLATVVMKSSIFWDITPGSPLKVERINACFMLVYCLADFQP
jgi:hypothetical protein